MPRKQISHHKFQSTICQYTLSHSRLLSVANPGLQLLLRLQVAALQPSLVNVSSTDLGPTVYISSEVDFVDHIRHLSLQTFLQPLYHFECPANISAILLLILSAFIRRDSCLPCPSTSPARWRWTNSAKNDQAPSLEALASDLDVTKPHTSIWQLHAVKFFWESSSKQLLFSLCQVWERLSAQEAWTLDQGGIFKLFSNTVKQN